LSYIVAFRFSSCSFSHSDEEYSELLPSEDELSKVYKTEALGSDNLAAITLMFIAVDPINVLLFYQTTYFFSFY
jgi:hypothetical protein